MSDVTQTDLDRAAHVVHQATADVANGNRGGAEWLAAILSVFRDEDFAAGLAAGIGQERERCAAMLEALRDVFHNVDINQDLSDVRSCPPDEMLCFFLHASKFLNAVEAILASKGKAS